MARKVSPAIWRFAKIVLTIALPFIMVWCAVKGALKEAAFEVRATWGEYLEAMRRKQ